MTEELDLDYLEKSLRERLALLTASLEERHKEAPLELDQTRVGRLSRMDAMQQQAVSRAAAHLASLEPQRIQAALKRLETGEYGYCLLCGDDIAAGRLRFDPSVPTCIACARKAET